MDIQCQLYIVKTLYEKVLHFFKRTRKKYWFWKKKPLLLTEESKSYQEANVCSICGKRILKLCKSANYRKVRDYCHYSSKYRGAAHSICNLKFNVPNKVPLDFHNGSNPDYHFIIKELANEFEGQFGCVGKNTEK